MENKKWLMDTNTFRKQLIDRQITTAFFNIEQRNEIGCVIELLDKQPTVDAVEVVRCRDCIYAEPHPSLANVRVCGKFKFGTKRLWMPEDGFCSAGERKAYES